MKLYIIRFDNIDGPKYSSFHAIHDAEAWDFFETQKAYKNLKLFDENDVEITCKPNSVIGYEENDDIRYYVECLDNQNNLHRNDDLVYESVEKAIEAMSHITGYSGYRIIKETVRSECVGEFKPVDIVSTLYKVIWTIDDGVSIHTEECDTEEAAIQMCTLVKAKYGSNKMFQVWVEAVMKVV